MKKGVAFDFTFYVFDGPNGQPKTGLVAGDFDGVYYAWDGVDKGALSAPNITEVHNTRHKGLYRASCTAAENAADSEIVFSAVPSNTDYQVHPVKKDVDSKVDVEKINGVTVTGSGTEADPWGP